MKIGKIQRVHRKVPAPIIIVLPKPKAPIPAPDIFIKKPGKVETPK